ncbi:MAG: hypothetical protein CL840_13165 [Crocinitomicaceae bacterium]|nr:hypothetical protein [Crocinitomicaceae bacterium]|tara:strand:+ start:979 stop:1380 length:402 start_codon:yes stop_codon:yes gene_type:complete
MAEIKSDEFKVQAGANQVQEFLSDMNNLKELMASDKIQNWESDTDTCSFTIKGLSGIGMRRDNVVPGEQINIVSHGKNPFDFTLNIDLNDEGESSSVQLTFDGNMNFMIQTMASGPLKNLFNMMGEQLVKKFS